MTCPRLEVRLDRLHDNAEVLVARLGRRGIGVTAVTKVTLGSPEVARCLLRAGVTGLGESRLDNVARLRRAAITAPITLIRSPMLSQVDEVVELTDTSLNTEPRVLSALSAAAVRQGRSHQVVLMVELGDLREGIMPADLPRVIASTLALPNLELTGIGANLACQNGIAPDDANMAVLTALASDHTARCGVPFARVSGGNSASYAWATTTAGVGAVTDLRLGEAIFLGREPLHRQPIPGLSTDAFTVVAEVIERSSKPAEAWGTRGETAFGDVLASTAPAGATPTGTRDRVIVAIGRQDVDPDGLTPPPGLTLLGGSSDHLVLGVDAGARGPSVGDEVRFGVDYPALLRAMTSPSVARIFLDAGGTMNP